MSPLFSAIEFYRNPEKHLAQLQRKFGDPFPLSFPGIPTVWMTGKSELARTIFHAPPDSFIPSENNPVAPLLGTEGLIMQGGQEHSEKRAEFVPFFTRKALHSFIPEIVKAFTDCLHPMPNKGVFELQAFAERITLNIILRFIFPHLKKEELIEASVLTRKMLSSYSPLALVFPNLPGGYKKQISELDTKFYEYYQMGFERSSDGFLYRCPQMNPSMLADQLRTLLVAGHETSSTSFTWALGLVLTDKEIHAKLISENPDNLEEVLVNKYLEAVVCESMRLHPPVPFITRKVVNRTFSLGAKTLGPGEEIGVCLSLLHRQPDIWDESDVFSPERFLIKKHPPHEFAPFGGGMRRCLGGELAMLELKLMLHLSFKHLDLELLNSSTGTTRPLQITIGPRNKLFVRYTQPLKGRIIVNEAPFF